MLLRLLGFVWLAIPPSLWSVPLLRPALREMVFSFLFVRLFVFTVRRAAGGFALPGDGEPRIGASRCRSRCHK